MTAHPLQNRVRPDGEIVSVAARGTMMGNRGGVFHTPSQTLLNKRWHSKQWICCVLEFKNRQRKVMQPRRYTELFFLDEATALSAGHRPCFECRRACALEFSRRWNAVRGLGDRAAAGDMDRVLHAERLADGGTKRTYRAGIDTLPDNTFVRVAGRIARIAGGSIQFWSFDGYGPTEARPKALDAEVLTPPSIVAVLEAGYTPELHMSATT
jgi:hypothetical protein